MTLLMVAILNFILFRVIPGDPASMLLSGARNSVTAEQIEAQRLRWGLDRPLIPDQLVEYVGATLHGDLGFSFKFRGKRVAEPNFRAAASHHRPGRSGPINRHPDWCYAWRVCGLAQRGAVDHIASSLSDALFDAVFLAGHDPGGNLQHGIGLASGLRRIFTGCSCGFA